MNAKEVEDLIRTVIREELAGYAVKKRPVDRTVAERMKRYRAKRNVTLHVTEGSTEEKPVTLRRNGQRNAKMNGFHLPEWLKANEDVWDAWIEARIRSKHPPTSWAKSLACTKLEKMQAEGCNVRALLADAAFHNWSSFWVTGDKK